MIVNAVIKWKDLCAQDFTKLPEKDKLIVLKWRNHPEIKRFMFTTDDISKNEHMRFTESLSNNTSRIYWLIKYKGTPIGVINLTNINAFQHSAELGVYKNPSSRLKNCGKLLMDMLSYLAFEVLRLRILTLKVLETNRRAIALYKQYHFLTDTTEDGVITMYKYNENKSGVFVIAELSANHGHDIGIAKKTIKAICDSGADAVKIQTYTADTMTIDCDNDYFKINHGTLWDGDNLYQLYQKAYMPWEWQKELKEYAEELGLVFFSTPFDKTSVDFLEELDVPLYKIASFEIMDIPLIEYIASKGKPVILSTGIASLADIEEAVAACKRAGNTDITLLKCTSSYPAPVEDVNLLTIPNLRETFGVKVGISDHTMGIDIPIASVALGATVIEKHFILDRSIGGPDAEFSTEPEEFKQMISSIRNVEKALGRISYDLSAQVKKNRQFCRSIFVIKDIEKGEVLSENNIKIIRPGYGMHPKFYPEVLGRNSSRDIKKGEPLSWNMLSQC